MPPNRQAEIHALLAALESDQEALAAHIKEMTPEQRLAVYDAGWMITVAARRRMGELFTTPSSERRKLERHD